MNRLNQGFVDRLNGDWTCAFEHLFSTFREFNPPRIPGFDSELTFKSTCSIPFINWNRTSVRVRRARCRCWWPQWRANTWPSLRCRLWDQTHCQCCCCYWKWRSANIILICLNHWLYVAWLYCNYCNQQSLQSTCI